MDQELCFHHLLKQSLSCLHNLQYESAIPAKMVLSVSFDSDLEKPTQINILIYGWTLTVYSPLKIYIDIRNVFLQIKVCSIYTTMK